MYSLQTLLALLLCSAAAVSAGKPEFSIGMNTAKTASSSLGGLEPMIRWSTGTRVGDVDLDGGLNLKVEDVREHPYNLWGQAKRTVAGWNLSARVNTYSQSISTLAVDLLAENGDTALQVEGTADTNLRRGAVNKLSLAQKLLGGALTMVPSYNLQTNQADISLTYAGLADTVVSVEASTGAPQVISISQRVGDAARLIPSVSSDGEVEIEYRQMIKDGMVAAVYKPNNAVTLKWFDGPWVATIDAPMTGPQTFTNELKVSIKRDVQVF